MRITEIECIPITCQLPYALTYARGTYNVREALLVKVSTDAGLTGWGESAMWGGPASVTERVVLDELAPLLIGEDPLRPEYLWEKCFQSTYYHGRKGIVLAALSGIDIALWDILGHAANLPLWRLLGGFGRPISAYASSGYYGPGSRPDDLAELVSKARRRGFRGYKMKVGNLSSRIHRAVLPENEHVLSLEEDLARVNAAKQAVGSGDLMCDATTSLRTSDALRYARAFDKLGIRWFEEPVEPENIDGAAEIARKSITPVAGFETETGRGAFARLIDAGAVQVVQPDVIQVGGLTEARKIAALAQTRHLLFTCKNYSTVIGLAACLHLLYALPNGDWFECDDDSNPFLTQLAQRSPVRIEDGYAIAGDNSGLGIEMDEDAVRRFA